MAGVLLSAFHGYQPAPYYEIRGEGNGLLLGVREAWLFRRREVRVDLGYRSYIEYCNSSVSFRNRDGGYFTSNSDLVWSKFNLYFIIDKEGNANHLNRMLIYRLFPGYKGLIDNYLRITHTSFSSQPDVEKLFAYCAKLGNA